MLPWKHNNVETDREAFDDFRRRMSAIHYAKVLVVGGGGREHAIVDALSRSSHVGKIYCAPGNAGIALQAECVPIKDTQVDKLLEFVDEKGIDLTVVGPEASLSLGIVDVFTAAGHLVFGPTKAAATIESSKDFAKRLMEKYSVPTAAYRTFEDYDKALEYVLAGSFPVVLKYDGLAAGKGVVIAENPEDALAALKDMLLDDKFGHGKVVVEEFMTGPEFSFLCFVCGEEVFPMVLSQDHKRAFEGDKGPNTGGMGAYSPLPFITPEDYEYALEHIMKPVAAGMVAEPFQGGTVRRTHEDSPGNQGCGVQLPFRRSGDGGGPAETGNGYLRSLLCNCRGWLRPRAPGRDCRHGRFDRSGFRPYA